MRILGVGGAGQSLYLSLSHTPTLGAPGKVALHDGAREESHRMQLLSSMDQLFDASAGLQQPIVAFA